MQASELPPGDRLDSWKDIAAYLRRDVRTVQLWEKNEDLPVHRHAHLKRATVYAHKSELDAWWNRRRAALQGNNPAPPAATGMRWTGAGASAVAVFLLCAAVWAGMALLQRPSPPAEAPKIVPLTTYPGNEMGAGFSPDGNQIAFAWKPDGKRDFDIYVKVVGSDRTLQLTNTADTNEVDPAWSPDGSKIAFHRSWLDGSCGVYTVSPLGGSERLVAEMNGKSCGLWQTNEKLSVGQLSWSRDGKWLAHLGVSLRSTETGKERRLTFPPTGWPDLYPAFSPDNKSLAFVRSVNASVQELYVVSLAGGKPARLPTQGQRIYGVAWTPDGRDLVYSSGEGDWANADLFRVSASGKSPPRPITGGERAWLPAIPLRGGRLGFTRQLSETNIWKVRTGTDVHQPASAVRVIASTQADSAPAFSPDGRRIAFNSDRSGGGQLWVCDRDGADATQMTFFPEGSRAGQGAWSPDGSQIAFTAQVLGNRDIYLISLSGGTPRRLTSDSSLDYAPSWSRDGKWVYFASDRTGGREVWKIAVQGGSSTQVTRHGGQRPVESPDGKYVYYEKGPTSVHEFEPWRVPVNGGEEERVLHDLGSRWTLARDGFYYYEQAHGGDLAGTWFLKFIEVARRADHVVAQLPGMPLIGHRPAVSPDRRTLLYAQVDLNETDMMLMENFR